MSTGPGPGSARSAQDSDASTYSTVMLFAFSAALATIFWRIQPTLLSTFTPIVISPRAINFLTLRLRISYVRPRALKCFAREDSLLLENDFHQLRKLGAPLKAERSDLIK